MNGRLSLTQGLVSARVEGGKHMDAAVLHDSAGLELALEDVTVFAGTEPFSQHAPVMLSLDMQKPDIMRLALLLLDKLGSPAFNAREWNEIRDVCQAAGHTDLADRIGT